MINYFKYLFALLLFALFSSAISFASSKIISAKEAMQHVGQTVTVCDRVIQTTGIEKAVFINFGNRYPNQNFMVVAWRESFTNFGGKPALLALSGKDICINGEIVLYKGVPEIILRHRYQLQ